MSNQKEQEIRKIEPRKRMRLSKPRIPPLDKKEARKINKEIINKSEWQRLVDTIIEMPESRALYGLNILSTLMRNKDLLMRFIMFNYHIVHYSSLPIRDREILILRITWLCYSKYEWGWHAISAKAGGHLSEDEINRIMEGPDAEGWDLFDVTLLRAVDELYTDEFITDETWNALTERYNTNQLMDLVFTVGNYHTTSLVSNTFGVQLEKGIKSFPE